LNTSELLSLAARAGIKFWLNDDRLAYRAPKGTMTDEIRKEIIRHKEDLITMLQRNHLDAIAPILRQPLDEKNGSRLSSGQERLWLIDRRVGENSVYNASFRLLWKGTLDQEALALSIQDLVARHAALRTTFAEVDGLPRSFVSPHTPVELVHLDLSKTDPGTRASAVDNFISEHERAPFDLERGPLLRTAFITLAKDDHVVLVTQHHIVTDGWSIGIFLTELSQGYQAHCRGRSADLQEPPLSYFDYVRWQDQRRQELHYSERLTWWRDHLSGLPSLALPYTGRISHGTTAHSGAVEKFGVPPALAGQLQDLARDQHCTLYTVLLTAWTILMHRYSSQSDFAVGTVVSGRDQAEFQKVIGFFANTLVLRCDLSGTPNVVEAITRMRIEMESALKWEAPFADVVTAIADARDGSMASLIQSAFIFQAIPVHDAFDAGDGLGHTAKVTFDASTSGAAGGTAKFDLSLTMNETHEGLSGHLEYATPQFSAAAIKRLGEHFLILLTSIVQDPREKVGRLDFISTFERQRLLVDWNSSRKQQREPR
jgi:hypothetical protein